MQRKLKLDPDILRNNKNSQNRNYWKTRFNEFELKSCFASEPLFSSVDTNYKVYELNAPANTSEILFRLMASDKARHIALLATLGVFISKYSSVTDMAIFSLPYNDDVVDDTSDNVIPVRMNGFTEVNFRDFLMALKDNLLKDCAHFDYQVHRKLGMEINDLARCSLTAMVLEEVQNVEVFDHFPVEILFQFSTTDLLTLSIKYKAEKFNEEMVVDIARLYFVLLGNLVDDMQSDIDGVSLLTKEDENKILYGFNNTAFDYPENETVIDLVGKQFVNSADSTAVWHDGGCMTYKGLNELSNRISNFLIQEKDVRKGDLVGIMLEREEFLLPCILAVLRIGAGYVPIDPAYPFERVRSIIQDAKMKCLISREKYALPFRQDIGEMVIDLESATSAIMTTSAKAIKTRLYVDSIAYIAYTSGSTGRPNGVKVSHGALVNYLNWAAQQYVKNEKTSFALYSSISFDLTVTSLFLPLITGNSIFLFREKEGSNMLIEEVIKADKAAIIKLTPSHLKVVLDSYLLKEYVPQTLQKLIVGGEQLEGCLARAILEKFGSSIEIYNEYGPTEATVGCMIHRFDPKEQYLAVPIGVPIHNTSIYLLDAQLRPVAQGVPGEIYISGNSLAKGYLHQEELTKQKFLSNPFVKGREMYKTGDLAIQLASGIIIYKGRVDNQVKIRGHRIELGDIEYQMKLYNGVEQAVVVVKERNNEKYLVAYYTSLESIEAGELQNFLGKRLPSNVVPASFVRLASMPLSPNGKINKKALPDTDLPDTDNYVLPESIEEKLLAGIWSQVLGVEIVGITDNFFSLGGDSIKSIQVISRVRSAGYEITIDDIFSFRVLSDLAEKLRKTATTDFPIQNSTGSPSLRIDAAPLQDHYALSAAQERIWILSRGDEGNIAYNMRSVFDFQGNLNQAALDYSFKCLIQRHEILRTNFKRNEWGQIRQYISPQGSPTFKIVCADFRQESQAEELVSGLIRKAIDTPFDLDSGYLLRAELYQLTDNRWIFAYVMHHIISDGWSMEILINELLLFYNAYINNDFTQIKPLGIHYKDFTVWQGSQLSREQSAAQKLYWTRQLGGILPVLAIPLDKARPSVRTYNGGTIEWKISAEISRGIKILGNERGCTLFMSLVALVNILLYKYTKQTDIVLGTPVAGREHIDLENQIGCYLNTLALRSRFSKTDTYVTLLGDVKKMTLDAFSHQMYPFDALLGELDLPDHPNRNPLFDVMVALQNIDIYSSGAYQAPENLMVTRYNKAENRISTFDLTFDFFENEEEIMLNIEYNSDLFFRKTVENMAANLDKVAAAVLRDPLAPIDQLEPLFRAEREISENTDHKTVKPSKEKQALIDDLNF